MNYIRLIVLCLSLSAVDSFSTIYVEDYPDLSEDFMPEGGDGEQVPTEEQVEQQRPEQVDTGVWIQGFENTPQGQQPVEEIGVPPPMDGGQGSGYKGG